MSLPRCYVIVDSVDWLRRLLPMGVKLVQLRIKDSTQPYVRAQVVAARRECLASGAMLVVNDYWQCAMDAGCDWVHLGQEDLATADIPALRRAGIRLGISTHSEEELDHALSFDPDYVALCPIYPTLLKQMPWGPQGLDRITQWKRRLGRLPLVAIGGLTVERLPGVFT